MANKIDLVPSRTAEDFTTPTSRYIESTPLYYTIGDVTYLTFSTYRRENIPPTANDKFAVIPASMEYRPDLMSKESYGTPDFWWKIMQANEIKDIFNFKSGLTIRIPDNIY